MRIVADRVNLPSQVLARELGIAVQQRMNPVMVLLQQGADPLPLSRGEFQILCQVIEFLIHRPLAMNPLRSRRILLGDGNAGQRSASMPINPTVKKFSHSDGRDPCVARCFCGQVLTLLNVVSQTAVTGLHGLRPFGSKVRCVLLIQRLATH
jgi:hypothetical protein